MKKQQDDLYMKKVLKKNIIIFISGLIVVFVIVSFTFPTLWVSQMVSRHLLDRENVFEKIKFEGDCEYNRAKSDIIMGSINPAYSCVSHDQLTTEERAQEISRIAEILIKDGWEYVVNSHVALTGYYKDDLNIHFPHVQPGENKLSFTYSHMSLRNYRDNINNPVVQ